MGSKLGQGTILDQVAQASTAQCRYCRKHASGTGVHSFESNTVTLLPSTHPAAVLAGAPADPFFEGVAEDEGVLIADFV